MSDPVYLTASTAAKIKVELVQLEGPERTALAERLRSAISMGDLSENADYHKAKEDQAFLEGRIQELKTLLRNAIVVEESSGPHEVVEIGARVTFQEDNEEPDTYLIVGAKEANPREGKISNESPIGRALMGGRIGEVAVAQTPAGELRLKILKVE
jgi:transcription elongation factor GreA